MIDEGRLNIGTDKVLKTLKCQQQNSDKHSNWTGSIKVADFNMSTTDNRNYGVPNFHASSTKLDRLDSTIISRI